MRVAVSESSSIKRILFCADSIVENSVRKQLADSLLVRPLLFPRKVPRGERSFRGGRGGPGNGNAGTRGCEHLTSTHSGPCGGTHGTVNRPWEHSQQLFTVAPLDIHGHHSWSA